MINSLNNSSDNQNIFGRDILDNVLDSSVGEENTTLGITSDDGAFSDPFNPELESLSLIEELIVSERENESYNSDTNNSPNLNVSLDSFTGGNSNFSQSEIPQESVANTSFAPPISTLELQGGFGDYDGGNDVTLSIEDSEGNVIETYALSGDGQGTLYTDDNYAYLFFSGTNESTEVDIDSKSNIKFGDFVGASLEIETTGSIDGGYVFLNDGDTTEEPGLVLKSGLASQENGVINRYEPIVLNIRPDDINDLGQIVGNPRERVVDVWNEGNLQGLDISVGDYIRPYSINNLGQIVGNADFNNAPYANNGFLYSNGTITNLGVLPSASLNRTVGSSAYDINDSGQIVGISSHYIEEFDRNVNRAFLYNGGEFKNLGSFEDSGSSQANAINNQGQVVGYSDSDIQGIYEAFLYENNQLKKLGALPGQNWSRAEDINDSGQIVGKSGQYAFLYENGSMKKLDSPSNFRATGATAINNLGQIVGDFYDDNRRGSFIYENGQMTNLETLIDPELNVTLSGPPRSINDNGQILAVGTYKSYSFAHLLLNPIDITPQNQSFINIGNISTAGDTVLLQGGEINLLGEAMTTAGGSVTLDGTTTINSPTSQFILNSSVSNNASAGGDITFTDTLDSESAGTQSLTLQAGSGNILLENNVGENAPFSDFTVAGAGTFNSQNITVDGNLTLEVVNDLKTEDLSVDGLTTISLGKVGEEIYDSTGNVATGNIDTLSLEVSNNGDFEAGDINTTDGDISVTSLDRLAVGQLNANNGAVDLISGTAGITVNGTVRGDNGFVALAQQDIVTNEITSSQDAVILKSSQGDVSVNGSVTAFEDVSLAAANDVVANTITVTSNEGAVGLFSGKETVTVNGTIVSAEDVSIGARKRVETQSIKSKYGGVGLVSNRQSVVVRGEIYSDSDLEILARRNIVTRKITSQGEITLESEQGKARINGAMRTYGEDIYVSSLGDITTRNIVSRGGDITLVTSQGGMKTGFIRSDRGNNGGKVHLQAYETIQVAASRVIDGNEYSIYTGVDDEEWIRINHQTSITDESQKLDFTIGDASTNGIKGGFIDDIVYTLKLIPQKPVFAAPIIGTVVTELVFPQSTAPRHQSEINPITGQVYADEAEFELVNALTDSQDKEVTKFINIPTYRLNWDYVEDNAEFGTATDEEGNRCLDIPLPIHLGTNYNNHHGYADYVIGSKDYILIPPKPIGQETSAIYDGRVQIGSAATIPSPLPSQSFGAVGSEPRNALGEVKTGHRFLLRIINGNPLPANPERGFPSDNERFEDLIDEIRGEALIAQACGEEYFISFDILGVARAGANLINSRLASEGINKVRVRYIGSPFN